MAMEMQIQLAERLTRLSQDIQQCNFRDTQRFLCRAESVFIDMVELEITRGMFIAPIVFDNICECIKLLEKSQDLPSGPGHIPFDISQEQIQYLLELGLTTISIADVLGVSRSTISRRMRDFSLLVSNKYSRISDDELDRLVCKISHEFPGYGHKMLQGHLRSKGVIVQ